MDENTFKIGVNPESTVSATQAVPSPTAVTPEAPQAAQTTATPPPAIPAPSAPQPTPPVINTKLNVQLDKSVDTQLSRLDGAKSKLLSAKSYLIIGIAIIALAAAGYGAYIFFFATESATEENFEDITLTNKLGGSENSTETTESPATTPPSLTINLSEEESSDTIDPTSTSEDNSTNPTGTTANSKVPR